MGNPGSDALVEPRSTTLPTEVAPLRLGVWTPFLLSGLGLAVIGAVVGDASAVQPLLSGFGLATTAVTRASTEASLASLDKLRAETQLS